MNILMRTCFVICFVLATFSVSSQPQNPQEDPDVPISGIGYLLAAGAAYGIKRIYDLNKKV